MSLVQRVTALEHVVGLIVAACGRCDSPYGAGIVLLRDGDDPRECPACGRIVDQAGRGVEALLRGGTVTVLQVTLHGGEAPR
jgi:hypothetical protein